MGEDGDLSDCGTECKAAPITMTVRVERLTIEANIGAHDHEHGITQPLIISVELVVRPPANDVIGDVIDYLDVVRAAEQLAQKHVTLIETFAIRLATLCLEDTRAIAAMVRVEKPTALSNGVASTCVRMQRLQDER